MDVPSFFRKGIRFFLPVVVIIVMVLWLVGVFHKGRIEPGKIETQGRPATGVAAYTVKMVPVPVRSEAIGTIQPEYKMTISSRVSANVVQMLARAGMQVQKGELLARLDDRDLRARVEQARETLRRAEATRDLAASDYQRDKPLFEKAVIPRSEFDQTEMRFKTAVADVQHAQEALREAEVALSYAEIRSPATGIVIDKLADTGDLAAPGKTLLTMYDPSHLWLEATVREGDASRLRIGTFYGVKIEAGGEGMEGRLVEIVPSADPASRTVTARIALSRTNRLYPGMFGRLFIPMQSKNTLLIPESAVVRVGQITMVDVIAGKSLKRRSIQTGERMAGNRVEVLSGLAAGEEVALPPSGKVKP